MAVLYAERCYGHAGDDKELDRVLTGIYKTPLKDFFAADMTLIKKGEEEENYLFGTLPKILLSNGPLSGVYDGIIGRYFLLPSLKCCQSALRKAKNRATEEFRPIFKSQELLCKILEIKAFLGLTIRKAYSENDRPFLSETAYKTIPRLVRLLRSFARHTFVQWIPENKDNGHRTQDLRLGGLIKRLETVAALLKMYLIEKKKLFRN